MRTLGVVLLAALAVSVSSCGDDDDDAVDAPVVRDYDSTLYGEWVSTSGNYAKDYIYFSSTGQGTKGSYDASIDLIEDEEDITWYTSADHRTLYVDGRAYEYWCDGSELEIKWKSNRTVTYREL